MHIASCYLTIIWYVSKKPVEYSVESNKLFLVIGRVFAGYLFKCVVKIGSVIVTALCRNFKLCQVAGFYVRNGLFNSFYGDVIPGRDAVQFFELTAEIRFTHMGNVRKLI